MRVRADVTQNLRAIIIPTLLTYLKILRLRGMSVVGIYQDLTLILMMLRIQNKNRDLRI